MDHHSHMFPDSPNSVLPPTNSAPSSGSFMADFAEATHDLLMEDSGAKRAAAAKRLASLGRPSASPYLIAALSDSASEVRQSAVEALGQLGDADAISSLEALLARTADAELQQAISAAMRSIGARVSSVFPTESVNEVSVPGDGFTMGVSLANEFSFPDQDELEREEAALKQAREDLERRRADAERRRREEDEKQRLAALEANRRQAEAEVRERAEQERKLTAAIELLRQAEAEQIKRLTEAEENLRAHETARQKAEAQARRQSEAGPA